MSLVAKVYDSVGIPASIHNATSALPADLNTNGDLLSLAAGERGTLEGLVDGKVTVLWWRQGGDVHVLALRGGDATTKGMATVQRAVVRMPADSLCLSLVRLSSAAPSVAMLGVVGVMPVSAEIVCARLEVGAADTSLYIRCLPDVYTSLRGDGSSLMAGVTAAAVSSGSSPSAGQLEVLLARGSTLGLATVGDDGVSRTAPVAAAAGVTITASSAVSAVAPLSAGSFAVARRSGDVSVVVSGAETPLGRVKAHHGVPVAMVGCPTAGADGVAVAVSTESGDVVIITKAASGVSYKVLTQPTNTASVASLFAGAGSIIVGWTGCELWKIPTSCAAAYRRHEAVSNSIVSRVPITNGAEGEEAAMWLIPDDTAEPFWFALGAAPNATLMAAADCVSGEVTLHVAQNPTDATAVITQNVFADLSPEEAVNTQCTNETASLFEISVVPLSDATAPRCGGKAFAKGLSLLGSVPSGVYSLHYLLYRALACPNRFANFSEFSEIRTDALLSSLANPGEEITEDDVREALSFVSVCEDTSASALCFATPLYAFSAVVQDLACRLVYLIVVYMGWVGSGSATFAASEVTAEVSHRAEVLAAAIRSVQALGVETCEVLAAHRARMCEGDDSITTTASDAAVPMVSTIVNELAQIDCGDVMAMVHVARMLTAVVPHGTCGGRATGHWVSVLKARNPAMGHYHVTAMLTAGATKGGQGAVALAEVFGVCAHLSTLPLEGAKQVVGALGMYVQQQYGALPTGTSATVAAERLAADVEALMDAYPALVPKLYRVLLLRKLTGAHCTLAPNHVESAFYPDLLIVRRYAADQGGLAHLEALLTLLCIDVDIMFCRAAIDEQSYDESFRVLGVVNREIIAALEHASAAAGISTAPLCARRDTIAHYVGVIVDRALAEGRSCLLTLMAMRDADINEVIANRLYSLSFATAASVASSYGPSTSSSKLSPAQAEAAEAKRLATACVLNDFLCQRSAYGLAAHALYTIAAAARTASQTTVNTAGNVTQLLSLAAAALKAIPVVPAPPTHLTKEAEAERHRVEALAQPGLLHRQGTAMMGGSGPSSSAPHGLLSDLRPMSRLDSSLVEKRLYQARCEQKLQRIPRNIVKGPWCEDAADKARTGRLVDELMAVRLWPMARRMAVLAGIDEVTVYQCEAADLAASDYMSSACLMEQWDLFIDRLEATSTVANGYAPLRRALAAALMANHRHVPPRLKQALGARDLGALILILLNSGKLQMGKGMVGSASASSVGDLSREASNVTVVGSFLGDKKLAGSIILEVLALATRYVRATDDAVNAANPKAKAKLFTKYGLSPKAFVSYPLLERVAALAESLLVIGAGGAGVKDHAEGKRRKEVTDAAQMFVTLLAKRNKA